MDASTRLYARLGEIPEDSNDPESLADLLVCAFGAFERYYVCWKTRGGEYRQDGYDLPPALKDWLYPENGSTRDFATLQVVFGRGEEYFASDKDGKLEYKEPEPAKPPESEAKFDKPAMRRSRTVSFLRPLSEVSTRSDVTTVTEAAESKRSSSSSSRRFSRPPSLSYSRTNSDASLSLQQNEELSNVASPQQTQPSLVSQWTSLGSSTKTMDPPLSPTKPYGQTPNPPTDSMQRKPSIEASSPTLALGSNVQQNSTPDPSSFQVPDGYMLVPIGTPFSNISPSSCTCGCHPAPVRKPAYVDTATQTATIPSPHPTALRINTTTTASSHWTPTAYNITSRDDDNHNHNHNHNDESSPTFDTYPAENPVYMGRMMNYFSKPGYQLGDSLMSGYQTVVQPVVYQYQYQYQDEFGNEALR